MTLNGGPKTWWFMSKWYDLTKTTSAPMRYIVSISGIPGVGKSTTLEALSKLMPKVRVFPEQVKYFSQSDFDLLDKLANKEQVTSFEKQHKLQKLYLQAEYRRWNDIVSSTQTDDLVMLDRGVEETVFAMESLGRQGLLDINYFVENHYRTLLKLRSSLVILLDASVATARQRVNRRNFEEDRSDYYDLFYQDYATWYSTNVHPLSIIETNKLSAEQVIWKVQKVIQKL
jgi:thymidylate kinase